MCACAVLIAYKPQKLLTLNKHISELYIKL